MYAFLTRTDSRHEVAVRWLEEAKRSHLSGHPTILVTHNYVVVESATLIHRRLGVPAVRAFAHELLPRIEVIFVDEGLHRAAMSAYVAALSRRASLVDFVSFEMMRERRLRTAFTFDRDFARHGFEILP